jgi:DNA-binding MarR family transcriptional regulator
MPLARKIEAELFSVLSEKERSALHDMLARLRENAGEFDAESLAD